MTYQVRTSNRGWTEHPDVFARMVPPVTVQHDPAIADHMYRLYYGDTPIEKARPIGEHSVSEIRKRVQAHETTRPARAAEVAPQVQAGEGGQMVLVL